MYIDAKKAIAVHVEWRSTFSLAIALQEELSTKQRDTIRYPNLCGIGRWLESLEKTSFRTHPTFTDLNAKHRRFHIEMERVAELLSQHLYTDARKAIGAGSPFMQASKEIALAITNLDTALHLSLPK